MPNHNQPSRENLSFKERAIRLATLGAIAGVAVTGCSKAESQPGSQPSATSTEIQNSDRMPQTPEPTVEKTFVSINELTLELDNIDGLNELGEAHAEQSQICVAPDSIDVSSEKPNRQATFNEVIDSMENAVNPNQEFNQLIVDHIEKKFPEESHVLEADPRELSTSMLTNYSLGMAAGSSSGTVMEGEFPVAAIAMSHELNKQYEAGNPVNLEFTSADNIHQDPRAELKKDPYQLVSFLDINEVPVSLTPQSVPETEGENELTTVSPDIANPEAPVSTIAFVNLEDTGEMCENDPSKHRLGVTHISMSANK
ncbi:hypothetical protein FJZ39_04175 [Candidatus Saccharibacteria bacterium]|nr:hypothetical protein [Candidatus Saccharibacteria bacterium]